MVAKACDKLIIQNYFDIVGNGLGEGLIEVTWKDGKTSNIDDVWLQTDVSKTIDRTPLGDVSQDILDQVYVLPTVNGFFFQCIAQ